MEAKRTPNEDETSTEQKGKLLRGASTGVLKQALNHYLARERDFVGVYFPQIVTRGYATYDDVFQLNDTQADALRRYWPKASITSTRRTGVKGTETSACWTDSRRS
jgi:hypothetical protein